MALGSEPFEIGKLRSPRSNDIFSSRCNDVGNYISSDRDRLALWQTVAGTKCHDSRTVELNPTASIQQLQISFYYIINEFIDVN